MQDDLIRLLNAQEIDLEIDKLIKHKKDYPLEIENLKKEVREIDELLGKKVARLEEIEITRRTIESEIAAERERLEEKEKRLLETKNNKEYTAVHNEIELARERIDALETEDLELMTEQDTLNPEIDETKKSLKETKRVNNKAVKEIQAKFDSIESDIAALSAKSSRELADVKTTRGMSIYTRLRKSKSGLSVATVDHVKHTCRGCFKQLPPQKVMEVRRATKIINCENCGRILVWDTRGSE